MKGSQAILINILLLLKAVNKTIQQGIIIPTPTQAPFSNRIQYPGPGPPGKDGKCGSEDDCSYMGYCLNQNCNCMSGYSTPKCDKVSEGCKSMSCVKYRYTIFNKPANKTEWKEIDPKCVNTPPDHTCLCDRPLEKTCNAWEQTLFILPIAYFNRVMVYSFSASCLIAIDVIGKNVWFDIEAYSDRFHFGIITSRHLRKRNIRSEAGGSQIRNFKDFNISNSYPYMIKKTLRVYDIKQQRITFKLTTFNRKVIFYKSLDVYVANRSCVPVLEANQFAPHVNKFRIYYVCAACFEVMIKYRCGYNDFFRHSWNWMTYGNEDRIFGFYQNNTRLVTTAYFFQEKQHKQLDRFMLRYGFLEYYNRSNHLHELYIYLHVYHDSPEPIIEGNQFTKVNVHKRILLDGGRSTEYGKKNNPTLSYHWSCQSKDYASAFCNQTKHKVGRTFIIEPNTLNIAFQYTFTLNVSTTTSTKTSTANQVLDLVDHDVLKAHIECVHNCKMKTYNNVNPINLLAICIKCDNPNLKFEWRAGKYFLGNRKRLIILNEDISKYLTNKALKIELKIVSGVKYGYCFWSLTKFNTADFYFSFSPRGGKELQHNFFLSTNKNNYWYSYYANRNELIHYTTFGGKTLNPVRLHHTTDIFVRGCTTDLSCFEHWLTLKLTRQPIIRRAKDLLDFIYIKQNYTKLLNFGRQVDASNLFVFASKQVQYMTNYDDNNNITLTLIDILERSNRTCHVEQHKAFTMLGEVFLNAMETGMPFLQRISNFVYTIVSELFEHNVNCDGMCRTDIYDFKIFNKHVYDIYDKIIKHLKTHNTDFTKPLRATTDPETGENYQDYGVIGYYLLDELEDFILMTRQFKSVMHKLAATASVLRYSGEPTINFDYNHTKVRIDFLDLYNLNYFEIETKYIIAMFSETLQKEIFRILNSTEVTMQTVVMDKNIHRWIPEDNRIYSQILYITLVNGQSAETRLQINDDMKPRDIQADIKIKFSTAQLDIDTNPHTVYINGYVDSMGDMPIYYIDMPKNCLVFLWIDSHTQDLLVLHRVGKRPTHAVFLNTEYEYLPVGSASQVLLINYHKTDTTGYLSILPAKLFESNFRIVARVFSCEVFFYDDKKWNMERCIMLHNDINLEYIPCYCLHLTAFALAMHIPKIELEQDRKILHEIPLNKVFALFLAILALLFTILFVIALFLERKSKKVIVIPSVCKLGDYKYYVTFFTGLQNTAGTTANITISLYGSECDDTFILPRSVFHNSFTSGSVTTVIFVTQYLGQILQIGASIDNYGHSPSWYLHMVRIKDYEKKHEYIFLVRQWLSLIYNSTTECLVKLTSEIELKRKKLLCREYAKYVFADSEFHFLQYQGRLNQSRKTMILFTTMMLTIFVLVIFFEKTTLNNYEAEDDNFRREMLPMKYMTFSALAALVSLVLSNLLLFLFREKGDSKYKLVHRKIIEV